ncbi:MULTISPECIES: CBS domain-containing protein [unclassified Nocardiopsis]|uniref:CBS domain-containing protein n=1 Tax=unclassified Nocardiopsis TaxID=2649073 RepID=UPI00135BC41B|nr:MULTISPECIES: CBS domain-containing protein [unclassified Nocardiopsis]
MTTAGEIMHAGAECVQEDTTLFDTARKMRELGVGALPICGEDDRLHGIITDRDIVLRCVAEGRDPQTCRAGELAQGKPFCVDAEDDVNRVVEMMASHRIKRVPVMRDKRLVGMISEADLAQNLPESEIGHFVEAIKSGPADRVG